jgi:hypothetical protein
LKLIQLPRSLLLAQLLTVLGIGSGCVGTSHRLDLAMEKNHTAKVMITGFRPYVMVDNQGPAPVTVTFVGRSESETTVLHSTAALRTFHEPTQVMIRTDSSGPAMVHLEARQVSAFIIDQLPSPAQNE